MYKFFTFSGVPKLLFVASERQAKNTETKFDFFDMGFLPLRNSYKNHDEVMNKIAYATHPFNFV